MLGITAGQRCFSPADAEKAGPGICSLDLAPVTGGGEVLALLLACEARVNPWLASHGPYYPGYQYLSLGGLGVFLRGAGDLTRHYPVGLAWPLEVARQEQEG